MLRTHMEECRKIILVSGGNQRLKEDVWGDDGAKRTSLTTQHCSPLTQNEEGMHWVESSGNAG